jgi:integrase
MGGLHGPRHTSLTKSGERTDPFTLQYVAGHDNIQTTMRYVRPRPMRGKQFPVRGERKRRVGAESGAVALAPHRMSR